MLNEPLVSVLIPTYNRCHLLSKAIRSALNQSYKNLEIIVSDNASNDATPTVVSEIATIDRRVKYFCASENSSPEKNWRRCLDLASGTFCFILCDDDFLLDLDYVTNGIKLLQTYNAGLLLSDCVSSIENQHQVTNLQLPIWIKGHDFFINFFKGSYRPVTASCIFDREIAYQCDPFKASFTAYLDGELWLKMMLFTDVVYYAFPNILYYLHGTNWITSLSLANYRANAAFIERVYEFAQGRSLSKTELLAWRTRVYRHYIFQDVLSTCIKSGLSAKDFAAFGVDCGSVIDISYFECLLFYYAERCNHLLESKQSAIPPLEQFKLTFSRNFFSYLSNLFLTLRSLVKAIKQS